MSDTIYTGTLIGTPGARAGVATLNVDGEALDVAADAAYDATIFANEMLIGQSGVQGFSQMPKTGFISAKCRDAGNLVVSALKLKTSATVVLELANGKVVTGTGMTCTECSEVSTQESTFTIKFESQTVTEVAL